MAAADGVHPWFTWFSRAARGSAQRTPQAVDGSRTKGPVGFHVTLPPGQRPISTTTAALRIVARVVLAQGDAPGFLRLEACRLDR